MRTTLKFLTLSLLVFVLFIAGGCTNRAMNSVIASWQNQQVSEVIDAWGTPSEELKIEGKRLLVWNTVNGILTPPEAKEPFPGPNARYCTRLLEVGRNGTIVHGVWEGTDCPGLFSGWGR